MLLVKTPTTAQRNVSPQSGDMFIERMLCEKWVRPLLGS